MHSQTEVFRRLVRDHMRPAPVRLARRATVREAIGAMVRERSTSALVVDAQERPVGILTEQDVVRRVALAAALDQPVEAVMSAPVVTIASTGYLFQAIALMRRRRLRHIPVVDRDGRLVGQLALHQALGAALPPVARLIEDLARDGEEDLRGAKSAQVAIARQLLDDSVPAPEVQALLSEVNHDIHRRILEQALADMAERGWGAPPVPFAAIVMGSAGRGESFLAPDQDNGFVLADYADEDHNAVDAFFVELAQRLTRALDAVGFPLCRGNVMATNPLWRKSLSQSRVQVDAWLRVRSENTLRHFGILADFVGIFGERSLAEALRAHVTAAVRANRGVLRDVFALEADHTVALGWFGRLVSERDGEDRPGMINLKYRGTLPLVEGARLLALRHGIAETATLARLDALRARGALHADDHDQLRAGFALITDLLLRQQLADVAAGVPPANFVAEAELSKRQRADLVACFRAIENLRGVLRSEFGGR